MDQKKPVEYRRWTRGAMRHPLLGNVVISKKIPTHTQDHGDGIATRERECIFIPLKIAKRKRYKNAVDGVVLAAIQIAEDPI